MPAPSINVADVISAAAQSDLGILALLSLIVGFIAIRLFNTSNDKVKVFVFVLMFAAAVAFGIAVIKARKTVVESQTNTDPDRLSPAGHEASIEQRDAVSVNDSTQPNAVTSKLARGKLSAESKLPAATPQPEISRDVQPPNHQETTVSTSQGQQGSIAEASPLNEWSVPPYYEDPQLGKVYYASCLYTSPSSTERDYGQACGKPAGDKFCKAAGFSSVVRFTVAVPAEGSDIHFFGSNVISTRACGSLSDRLTMCYSIINSIKCN